MKDKLEALLIKKRADYLNNISRLVDLPHLKTRYRIDANTILEEIQETPEHVSRACPKCLLHPFETQFRSSIKPEKHNRFKKKYMNKLKWTKYQLRHAKQLPKLSQQLLVQCTTCKTLVKLPLKRPPKEPLVIEIVDTPIKSKKKKKQRDNLAGINKSAVEQAQMHQKQAAAPGEFISLQLTPASSNKRKWSDVIEIEDSPLAPPAKKQQKRQANEVLIKTNNNTKEDIKRLKQQSKDVQDARNALASLATKKDKKKLKHKLKKINDSIKNIEHTQARPSSLQDFLSTLST